jgi:cellulose biosynthesis protein BcsQ
MNPRKFRIQVSTLKGGPGKTTTAFLLALALSELDHQVVLICADPKSQGSRDWYRKATARANRGQGLPVPFTLLEWNSTEMNGRPAKFCKAAEAQYPEATVIIVDTGGEAPEVFSSTATWADYLIVPCGAQDAELARMPATFDAAAEISETRPEDRPLLVSALLTRVPAVGLGSAREAREYLDGTVLKLQAEAEVPEAQQTGLDMHVLGTEVKYHKARYCDIYGTNPTDLGAYADLAVEIIISFEQQEDAA